MMSRLPLLLVLVVTWGSSPSFGGKFWHFTDLHLDYNYTTGGDKANMCHSSPAGLNDSTVGPAGDYLCDSPKLLVKSLLAAMRNIEPNPDFFIWTGDSSPHIWKPSPNMEYITQATKDVFTWLEKKFPGVPVFPALGNHDSDPPDTYPDNKNDSGSDSQYDRYWKAGAFGDHVGQEGRETFKRCGYYSKQFITKVGLKLRMVVLNTNIYYNNNATEVNPVEDPCDQLQWLENTLNQTQADEKVYIIGHVPPGAFERSPKKSTFFTSPARYAADIERRFVSLVSEPRYRHRITAHFYGHIHTDSFRLFLDRAAKQEAVGVAFLASSSTPLMYDGGVNPGMRLVQFSDSTGAVEDYFQYGLDLESLENSTTTTSSSNITASSSDTNTTSSNTTDSSNTQPGAQRRRRDVKKKELTDKTPAGETVTAAAVNNGTESVNNSTEAINNSTEAVNTSTEAVSNGTEAVNNSKNYVSISTDSVRSNKTQVSKIIKTSSGQKTSSNTTTAPAAEASNAPAAADASNAPAAAADASNAPAAAAEASNAPAAADAAASNSSSVSGMVNTSSVEGEPSDNSLNKTEDDEETLLALQFRLTYSAREAFNVSSLGPADMFGAFRSMIAADGNSPTEVFAAYYRHNTNNHQTTRGCNHTCFQQHLCTITNMVRSELESCLAADDLSQMWTGRVVAPLAPSTPSTAAQEPVTAGERTPSPPPPPPAAPASRATPATPAPTTPAEPPATVKTILGGDGHDLRPHGRQEDGDSLVSEQEDGDSLVSEPIPMSNVTNKTIAIVVTVFLAAFLIGASIFGYKKYQANRYRNQEFLLTDSVFRYDGYSQLDDF